jgi:hypothetical protein
MASQAANSTISQASYRRASDQILASAGLVYLSIMQCLFRFEVPRSPASYDATLAVAYF